jgi:hypothetical protein
VVVEPVDAADAVNGVTLITATAEPVLAATTTESSTAEPTAAAETAIPFDIIDVEVVSAAVPLGITTVHVTGVAVTGAAAAVFRAAATVAGMVEVSESMLYAVKVMTYVPGSVGVKLTGTFWLAKAYVVADTAVSIQ